ncbi:pyridine nucleotide-disulfide oxidoreductase family protein [Ehrlichia chaffeensis str. Heartland]|uniref:Ferredoxin--NADP reductase n=1 Tax=Ehrlichia chaffeensis (strain ATCC CRL-10679 / Arkansas) TaxID=205920 RepID=FENR_EHRCR|nr:NAD(P)/FAD-dependent oxidoreductase [Ehrlichia chaffeensis]Q2GGH5.1 RecName: Full=Ferredoxin--NADP reductase; Short=FNR; Short=Fd-NADP(+) reductase [Ehrlichia chaffeensis str. Arkansas]ABD44655.1 pyridine nucleotide-disulphide oxidoreductase family protein [Ehrlichia chaffeensis str. Arkansas]AHX03729.1 pyridine nucleotide-disulfide oxidoreductase family protein [Ehrlichia chaffeensis str. Heartland]AHX05550.1 pyridine nucleotide-disulfide oxidoreductase family protein [Ehrlichia chaffeensis
MTDYVTDIAVIGAGPVGIFTVFQAGMLKMRCCVIDALSEIGGQCLALYPEKPIYDIPGYPVINGKELIDSLKKQSEPFNPQYLLGQVAEKIEDYSDYFLIRTTTGIVVQSKVIIIAAGAGAFGPNRLPIDNILDYENKSVFYQVRKVSDFCDKNIMIAGGGDSAADWAVELSKVAKQLYVVHRRKNFRCAPNTALQMDNLSQSGKIKIIVPYQVKKLCGENGKLHSVIVKNITNHEEMALQVDYLFPFFGTSANLGPILNWGMEVKNYQILVNAETCLTNRNRIYAVGDIATYPGKLKLILTGFSEAAMACHHIYHVIYPNSPLNFQYSTSKGIPENC